MRKSVLIVCCLVLAACLWLLLHGRDLAPTASGVTPAAVTNENAVIATTNPVTVPVLTTPAQTTAPPSAPRPKVWTAGLPTATDFLQKPISFYGKVIDENSNPVVGVNISFRWNDMTAENQERTSSTESDSDGLFSLLDKHGASMTLVFGKEGYYASHHGQMGFNYAFGQDVLIPDSRNPVILHVRKKGHGEALVEKQFPPGFSQIWQLHHDGTPIELDLLNGNQNVTGNGQLELEFWRDPPGKNTKRFDWKLQISTLGGGLIETNEEFAFEAPKTGYQPSLIINMPATNQDWSAEFRSKYYVQLPNGDYGRFDIYFIPRNGVFTVHSAVNAAGSRNLEPAD